MAIQILPALREDIPTLVRIELAAFAPHPRIPMLYPKGYTPDLYAFYELKKAEALADPCSRLLKAIDSSTGTIVGACELTIARDPAEHAKRQPLDPNEPPPSNWPEGANWGMRHFFAINSEKLVTDSFAGKAYIVVDILVVDPEHQSKGIGSALLGWAVKEANERDIPLGLESSPAGLALYKRWGFKEVQVIKADMKMFGWEQPYDEENAKRVWMIKHPGTSPQ